MGGSRPGRWVVLGSRDGRRVRGRPGGTFWKSDGSTRARGWVGACRTWWTRSVFPRKAATGLGTVRARRWQLPPPLRPVGRPRRWARGHTDPWETLQEESL